VCLLKNEPATYRLWQVKGEARSQSESESEKGEELSQFVDPNPGDLTMSRMKLG
jgi:hypothetical protein